MIFLDASEIACEAMIYIKSTNSISEPAVKLLLLVNSEYCLSNELQYQD